MSRFDYVKFDKESQRKQERFKKAFMDIEALIEDEFPKWSDGPTEYDRAKALLLTHLEIAYMWVGKGVRDQQREYRGARMEESRGDS